MKRWVYATRILIYGIVPYISWGKLTRKINLIHKTANIRILTSGTMRADDIQEAHRISHYLDDVKITLLQNINIRMGDIDINGKTGEVINAPLWAGKILEKGNFATLDIPDAVTELKQATVKEQMVGKYQLATLDEQFYIRLQHQMLGLQRRDRDGVESMMVGLFRMRRGKIVQLADSTKLTADIKSRISIEERSFFEAINREGELLKVRVGANE